MKKDIDKCIKIFQKMAKRSEVQSILIEGIGKTISSFLKNEKIDWKIMYKMADEIVGVFNGKD